MLMDSAHIQEQEAEWQNRKAARSGSDIYEPIYTVADCDKALKQFVEYGYEESVEIFWGIKIEFIDAEHLLGSSSIHITINENKEVRTIIS